MEQMISKKEKRTGIETLTVNNLAKIKGGKLPKGITLDPKTNTPPGGVISGGWG